MAVKWVKEVNILNTQIENLDSDYQLHFPQYQASFNKNNYSGTVSVYYEVVGRTTLSTWHVEIRRGPYPGTTWYSIEGSSTSWELVRQLCTAYPSGESILWPSCYYFAGSGYSTQCRAVRVVVIQTATNIMTTESQIEIGSYETGITSTSATALTYPKIWKYTAANWDGICRFYGEVVYSCSATKYGTATIILQHSSDQSSWSAVSGGTIVSGGNATAATIVRSSAFTPTDGYYYRIAVSTSATKGPIDIYAAKIIVEQYCAESVLSKTENGSLIFGNTSATMGRGQSFLTTSNGGQLHSVSFLLYKSNSPTDNVYCDVASSINGSALATTDSISGSSIGTSVSTQLTFVFSSPPTLSGNTTYYVRIYRSGSVDGTNYYSVRSHSSAPYANGDALTNNAGTWGTYSSYDLWFQFNIGDFITKTETTRLFINWELGAAGFKDYDQYWDPDEWEGVTVSSYHEIVGYDTLSVGKLQQDPNGSPSDIPNSSVTGTGASYLARGASAMTMPGTAQTLDCYVVTPTVFMDRIVHVIVVSAQEVINNLVEMVITNY